MLLEFIDLYGQPVFVRPERIDAVKGINLWRNSDGGDGALIVLTNRETFRVRGSAQSIADRLKPPPLKIPVPLNAPSAPPSDVDHPR